MLRTSLAFFILSFVSFAVGAFNIAGVTLEFGKFLFFVFLVVAVITFLSTLLQKPDRNAL